jgi:hypothetical protein
MPRPRHNEEDGPPTWNNERTSRVRGGSLDRSDNRPIRRAPPRRTVQGEYRTRDQRLKKPISQDNVEDPNRKIKIAVVAVATILFLALLPFWISAVWIDEGGESGPITALDTFMDGSKSVMINTTYVGADAYFTIPGDASIDRALVPQRISFMAGRNPTDIAVGDVDGDLFSDVVVANYKDDAVLVMNHKGTGLVRGQEYPVGNGPIRVELVELNGDGFVDLLVLSEDSKEFRVMVNDQIGGFRLRGDPFIFPTLPSDMTVVDFDGDGDNDTAVITTNNNNLTLFQNDGNGNLLLHSNFTTQGNPTRIAVTDYDLDGMDDLVISNRRDIADMDGDRHQVEKEGRMVAWLSTVSIWKNIGGGNFIREMDDYKTEKGVSSIACGDINGDEYPDIVMTNLGYHTISIIESTGDKFFKRGLPTVLDSEILESMDPIQVQLLDMDHDGDLDIMAITKSADSILYYSGDGRGNFLPFTQYYVGLNPTSFEMMDYDSDGDLDVITSDWKGWIEKHGENGTVSVLTNLRSGIFGTYKQYPTGNSPRGVFAKDIDGDGDMEIATANYFGSTVSILRNDGLGQFTEKHHEYPIGLEPYAVVMEDFDGDGRMDGASADEANFRIVLMESDGKGGFTSDRFLYDIGAYPFSLRTGDIDGDGDIDLFTSNYFQGSTTLMFNDGSGNFGSMFNNYRTISIEPNMPYDSLVEDFNGDGVKDLVTVNRGDTLDPTSTITVMINAGDYLFEEMVTYNVGKEPTSAVAFDIDGDGDLDIATTNTGDDTVSIMINNGNGAFSKLGGIDYPAGDRPQYINTLDMDEDGWMDYIVTNTDTNNLVFLRNLGPGNGFELREDLNIASYPFAIDTGDFNQDGRMDIVLSAVNTNNVIVLGCYWYPKDVSIDIGADGTIDKTYEGLVTGSDSYELDMTEELREYLKENDIEGTARVPIRVITGEEGVVVLSDLLVIYR